MKEWEKMMERAKTRTADSERDAGDEDSSLTSRFSSCGSLGEKDLGNF